MKPNQWQSRYGARRSEIDRKLLAALEKQIASEERATSPDAINPIPSIDRDAERRQIALAFGRPLT